MNNDLISRSALIEGLNRGTIITDDIYGLGIMIGIDYATRLVNDSPSVDAVEVVRCKDCRHYGSSTEPSHGVTVRYCKTHEGLVLITKDTFCSYGERKEDEK